MLYGREVCLSTGALQGPSYARGVFAGVLEESGADGKDVADRILSFGGEAVAGGAKFTQGRRVLRKAKLALRRVRISLFLPRQRQCGPATFQGGQ